MKMARLWGYFNNFWGFFEDNDADLRYQDEVQGALILQVDKAVNLIYLKYLKALIHYEGVQRIDEYMFPRERIQRNFA